MAGLCRLSVKQIEALKPKSRPFRVGDGAGLFLEISPRGLMSWRYRFKHRGKAGIVNIGRFPALSLAEARNRRQELIDSIRAGRSPVMKGMSLKDFGLKYLREVVQKNRKKGDKPIRRYLERDVFPVIGERSIASIRQDELRDLIWAKRDGIEGVTHGRPQAALILYHLLKRMWNYALVCGAAATNPLHLIPAKYVASAHSRKRALSEAEIAAFLKALPKAKIKPEYRAALYLILLTLVRKSELRLAEWKEFNFERAEWEIPAEHEKNHRGAIVYLSTQALALLRGLDPPADRAGCVLYGREMRGGPISASTLNRALRCVEQVAKIEHFTVHDLRRTASTRLNELGFDKRWVEKQLNHEDQTVAGVYNRAEYAEQRRGMLQQWADYLEGLKVAGNPRTNAH
jgi:integrase